VAGHQVGVDVVGLPRATDADWRDDGNEAVLGEEADGLGVDRLDLADEPDVDLFAAGEAVRAPAGPEQARVLAREADGPAAVMIDAGDDFLVVFSHQPHLASGVVS